MHLCSLIWALECFALGFTDFAMPSNMRMEMLLQTISNGRFICFATIKPGHIVGLSLVTVSLLPSTFVFSLLGASIGSSQAW